MSVDPIITMGYGPNSSPGTIMRWGYIGIGEIIARAVQGVMAERREAQRFMRSVYMDIDILANTVVPIVEPFTIEGVLVRGFAKAITLLGDTLVPYAQAYDMEADIVRLVNLLVDIYSDTISPIDVETTVSADTITQFIYEVIIEGRKDMDFLLWEILLADDEEE